jgi:hypothetical protein
MMTRVSGEDTHMTKKTQEKSSGEETKGFDNAENLDAGIQPAGRFGDDASLVADAAGADSRPTSERVIRSKPERDARLASNASDDAPEGEELSLEDALTALVAKAQSRGFLIEPGEIARLLDKSKA